MRGTTFFETYAGPGVTQPKEHIPTLETAPPGVTPATWVLAVNGVGHTTAVGDVRAQRERVRNVEFTSKVKAHFADKKSGRDTALGRRYTEMAIGADLSGHDSTAIRLGDIAAEQRDDSATAMTEATAHVNAAIESMVEGVTIGLSIPEISDADRRFGRRSVRILGATTLALTGAAWAFAEHYVPETKDAAELATELGATGVAGFVTAISLLRPKAVNRLRRRLAQREVKKELAAQQEG